MSSRYPKANTLYENLIAVRTRTRRLGEDVLPLLVAKLNRIPIPADLCYSWPDPESEEHSGQRIDRSDVSKQHLHWYKTFDRYHGSRERWRARILSALDAADRASEEIDRQPDIPPWEQPSAAIRSLLNNLLGVLPNPLIDGDVPPSDLLRPTALLDLLPELDEWISRLRSLVPPHTLDDDGCFGDSSSPDIEVGRCTPLDSQSKGEHEADSSGISKALESTKTLPCQSSWHSVQRQLLELYDRGEPYTSVGDLAKRLGCSKSTVHHAIETSHKLKGWQKRHLDARSASPRARSLNDVDQDRIEQKSGVDQDHDSDTDDIVFARLIQEAEPEERAKLNSMDPEQRRELVALLRDDPHTQRPRLLGRKP